VPSDTTPGRRQQETRTFATTRRELESLGDWLACWGVTKIGMEATGDYWKPVFFLLESRVRLRPVQRRAGQGPARPAQDGPVNRTVGRHRRSERCLALGIPAGAMHGYAITTVAGVEPGQIAAESGYTARYQQLSFSSSML